MWQRGREDIVFELMRLNYKCLIKSVKLTALPKGILGMFINEASVSIMKSRGIDICRENGEYHTLAVDGPIFQTPLHYVIGDIIELGEHAVIDIQ